VSFLSVLLNNSALCALDDGSGIKYVTNTGRIAGVSDRVCLDAPNSKPIERGLEAIELDRVGVEGQDRGIEYRRDCQR